MVSSVLAYGSKKFWLRFVHHKSFDPNFLLMLQFFFNPTSVKVNGYKYSLNMGNVEKNFSLTFSSIFLEGKISTLIFSNCWVSYLWRRAPPIDKADRGKSELNCMLNITLLNALARV